MKPRVKITLSVVALFVVAAASFAPIVHEEISTTDVTAATVEWTSYFGLPPIVTHHDDSPLSAWCRQHHVTVHEKSAYYVGITQNLWGYCFVRGCRSGPAIYAFPSGLLKTWLAHTSDADIRRFVADMEQADAASSKRLVDAAIRQALAAQ